LLEPLVHFNKSRLLNPWLLEPSSFGSSGKKNPRPAVLKCDPTDVGQAMPRKKGSATRAATIKRKGRAPSAPKEQLGALPAAGNRKRSAKQLAQASSQESDDNQEWLPSSAKKRKVSCANALALSSIETEQAPPVDAESGGSGACEAMDLDDEAGNGSNKSGKPDKKSKFGLDTTLPPISDVREMFEDMVARLGPHALKESPVKLNVATLCSGTDAPIFALGLIQDALQTNGFGPGFEFRHLFSCEIEPFKQGFIRRNLPPDTLIFRDVVELASECPAGQV
jgi:hypothetical protein